MERTYLVKFSKIDGSNGFFGSCERSHTIQFACSQAERLVDPKVWFISSVELVEKSL